MWSGSQGDWLHLPWTHFAVPIIPGGGRRISPNSASYNKVWAEAEAHPLLHRTFACSLQHTRRCFAEPRPDLQDLCSPLFSVGTSKVILKREGWVMETATAGSDSEWVLMSVLFWFQLTGLCHGVVPTVHSTRKEVKQRKKQMDSEEEYSGRWRERGGGQEEHEHLQGLSRTSPRPAANDFFFFVCPLLLWPPPTPATVQSHRVNHSKLLFDGLNKLSRWLCPPSRGCCC